MQSDVKEREARIPDKGGEPIPPMRADVHSDADPAVETPVEARQGFLDRPVLVVLHPSGEKPRDMMDRWAEAAREHGYILAAPEWTPLQGGAYGYSADDHNVVLRTLRDLKLRFQIDSDRVFLHGYRQGGNMAYDVGLSHPDLFAGVLPMAAPMALPSFLIVTCSRSLS